MGLLLSQKLVAMGREVRNEKPSPGGQNALGFADRTLWRIQKMEHLVHGHEVEPFLRHVGGENIRPLHAKVREPLAPQLVARDRQHLAARVEAKPFANERCEQFQHPSRARAEIEHGLDRRLSNKFEHRALDRFVRCVERPNTVPVNGVGGEVVARRSGVLSTHCVQPFAVARKVRIARVELVENGLQRHQRLVARKTEVGPCPFLMPLDQPGFDQKSQVTGNTRLRLAEHARHIADGQVAVFEQCEKTHSRRFARNFEQAHGTVERKARVSGEWQGSQRHEAFA